MLESTAITSSGADQNVVSLTSTSGLEFLICGPQNASAAHPVSPPLVSIHGVARNHREHARAFAGFAHELGIPLIVPLFEAPRFKGYQRLERATDGLRPDEALLGVLQECHASFGWPLSCRMFGFSGGAQFAHRFVMLHGRYGEPTGDDDRPHVERLALASAGFYTMPDDTVPFPEGLGSGELSDRLRIDRLLNVPTRLFVGERDVERDRDLRVSARLDRLQGRNRFERAQRFVFALRSAAAMRRQPPQCTLEALRSCGHSFRRCVRSGGLDTKVLRFLYPEIRSRVEGLESRLEKTVAPGEVRS